MMPRSVLLRQFLLCVSCLFLLSVSVQADEPSQNALSALSRPIQVRAHDAPLRDVLKDLAKQAEIEIRIADEELALIDLNAESEAVSCVLRDAPLRVALRALLARLDLTWRVDRGELLITTEEKAAYHLETEYFDVVDLVVEGPAAQPGVYDYDVVDNLITSTIAPDSWDDVGGLGEIRHLRGKIAVSQTRQVLQQIPTLLAGLREARKLAMKSAAKTPARPSVSLMTEPEIAQALARPFTLSFDDTPLREVVLQLQAAYGVAFYVKDYWADQIEPISFSAADVTLQQALDRILQPSESGWRVEDGSVVISEDMGTNQITRAYPVLDLLGEHLPGDGLEEHRRDFDFEDLMHFTSSMVSPDSWDIVGGPCAMEAVHDYGLIVVTQTSENHTAIEKLYAQLRSEFADRPRVTVASSKRWKDRQRLAVYVFATPESERARDVQTEQRTPELQATKPRSANQPLRAEQASSPPQHIRQPIRSKTNSLGESVR